MRKHMRRKVHPIVKTAFGFVKGAQHEDGIVEFKGIPYGKASRFKKPEFCEPWFEKGPLHCFHHGKMAIQEKSAFGLLMAPSLLRPALQWYHDSFREGKLEDNCHEDCLNLIIKTPSIKKEKLFPVMVFVHGGGFTSGSGCGDVYNPKSRRLEKENVVTVNINYRLGIFGFLKTEDGDMNCGLLDQILALKWIRQNIENFGGDSKNVTIFGESAGGISSAYLLGIPQASELFDHIIIQSGPPIYCNLKEDAEKVARVIAGFLKVEKLDIKSLQKFSSHQLQGAQKHVMETMGMNSVGFAPAIDDVLITDIPLNMIKENIKLIKDKRVIISYCKDENSLFSHADTIFGVSNPRPDKEDVVFCIEYMMNKMEIPELSDKETRVKVANDVVSKIQVKHPKFTFVDIYDYWNNQMLWIMPCEILAGTLCDAGLDVYMCRFDTGVPAVNDKCVHAIDLLYVFGVYDNFGMGNIMGSNHEVKEISHVIIKAWSCFAKGEEYSFHWPKYSSDKKEIVIFKNKKNKEKQIIEYSNSTLFQTEEEKIIPSKWLTSAVFPSRGFIGYPSIPAKQNRRKSLLEVFD